MHIQQHHLLTVTGALAAALEQESYQLVSKQKAWYVKEIQLKREQLVQSVTTSKGTVAPGDVL